MNTLNFNSQMNKILQFLLLVFLVCTGIYFFRKHQERKIREQELRDKVARAQEEERQRNFDLYRSKLPMILKAQQSFAKYLDFKSGYFSNYLLTTWIKAYYDLFQTIVNIPYEGIQLQDDEVTCIKCFLEYFNNSVKLRDDYNKGFIQRELEKYSRFFDSVEGRKLDIQQRTAIVINDDNSIVIAGAGSGKTTTIVGKTNYILSRYKVSPEEILLISFTNKSANTLAQRINIEGITANTFHKFGMDVIAKVEGRQPSIFDEKQYRPLLSRKFSELIRNQSYLEMVTDYFINYLKPIKSQFEFANKGDYIQYIKDQNFRTYKLKHIPENGRSTYKMEVVKSIEECKIANFLLLNNLDYEYELPYEHDTANESYRQYKPDFTVIQNGKKTYIEHFAVSQDGNVPPFFARDFETQETAKKRYWEKIEWARELHKTHSTTLIETYSYEMGEGSLFDNLTRHLQENGITLSPKSTEEIWRIIENAAKEEVSGLVTLLGTFITLMKSNNYTIQDVLNRNQNTGNNFLRKRNTLFLNIVKPIADYYESYLAERKEIDFSDMINKAASYISNGKYKRKFSYVVVDEFQDISVGRYQLIKAIKEKNPACKLFCVGDDWQSIYRFSGSDIALFKEFEKYFGYTVKSQIETTYRFHAPLIDLSSDFIQKNPNQARKQLKSVSNNAATQYKIHYSFSDKQDDSDALQEIFNTLLATDTNINNKEILILGRYGFDIDRIKNEKGVFNIDRDAGSILYSTVSENGNVQILEAKFLTVHKAKGLEADIVIVINCNSGKFGFPSEMSDDPVLNLILSEADQFENGEERRLFYVAMTRAKEQLFLVADSSFKSKFIAELETDSGISPNQKCPVCKSADVVLRKTGTARTGSTYKFFGCSNYLYGCDYTTTEWDNS